MKRIIKIIIPVILIILISLTIILLAASWHFSSQIINPKPCACNKEHFVFCTADEIGLPYKNVEFTNNDGLKLKGWFFKNKSKKAIIFVHGITASRVEGLRWVKSLYNAKYNLLLFDLRNHGESDKAKTSMGFYEKDDVIAAVDFLKNKMNITKVGVFGVSMGASTAIQAMAVDKRILAGAFEAGFANLKDELTDIAKRDYGLQKFPLIDMVMWIYSQRLGYDANKINPENYIGKISPRPVFIIHCENDNYISYKHGLRLFKAAKQPKKFYKASCTVHARAWQSDHEILEKMVVKFFNQNIK